MADKKIKIEDMDPIQKAAVALVVFGKDVASEVFKNLNENEIERLTVEIANLREVPPEVEEDVIKECHSIFMARHYVAQGGIDYARDLLEGALGKGRANEVLKGLEGSLERSGFDMLKHIDPRALFNMIQHEHPQTISLIMTQLNPQQAAAVLTELAPELQSEVIFRLAMMEKISPDIMRQLEDFLDSQFDRASTRDLSVTAGAKSVAEILNIVDTASERRIMKVLESEDAEIANEIKNLMFVFEDLVMLDDRSMQRLLKEVETKELAKAMKTASDDLQHKIFSNVSERVGTMIREEMEYLGPMRLSDVEKSQEGIVAAVRRLEDQGEVVIPGHGGAQDVFV
jgi:flagellar motor switch protein FliG